MKQITFKLVVLIHLAIFANGCATSDYFADRGNDAMDMFTLTANFSFGARARTGPLHAGLGMSFADYGLGGGQFGKIGGGGSATQFGSMLDMTLMSYEKFHVRPDYRKKSYDSIGTLLLSAETEKDDEVYWPYFTQVEVLAGFGYGIRAGFNMGEMLDFLLGFGTIDIYGDDIGVAKTEKLGPFILGYSPRNIQIIGNKEELWIFIESFAKAERPNPNTYKRVESVGLGTVQEVIILNKDGLKNRIIIPGMSGVSFHSNLTHLFADSDGIYLFDGESMNYFDSIFKWDKDHFKLLPLEESEEFLARKIAKDKKITLEQLKEFRPAGDAEDLFNHHTEYHGYKDGKIEIPYGVFRDMLDKLSKKNGWTNYTGQADGFEWFIDWNEIEVEMSKIEKGKSYKLEIASPSFKQSPICIDYTKTREISRSEIKQILKQKDQTGHRKGFWD